jgi:hypothetical protein
MPGRSLTRPCPGTGRRLTQFESPPPPPFRYSARVHVSPGSRVAVAIHLHGLADGSGALSGTGKLGASRLGLQASAVALGACARPPFLREHGAAPASLRRTHRARECFVSFLRHHTREPAAALCAAARWRRQTAGFGVSVCSGYDAHACASVPPTSLPLQTPQTVSARWRVTPRFQLAALHSARRGDRHRATDHPRPAPRTRRRSPPPTLHSVLRAETSETR